MINYKFSQTDSDLTDQELYLKILDSIDKEKIPYSGKIQDEITRMINFFRGNPICTKCSASGNELSNVGLFRKCSDCGGDGIKKIRELTSLEQL